MCMNKMPGTATNFTSSSTMASSSTGGSSGVATGGPSSSSSTNRRNASQSDETDSASDEVKVFNDEDEQEPAPSNSESRNHLDFLTNIKSSLISETEQVSPLFFVFMHSYKCENVRLGQQLTSYITNRYIKYHTFSLHFEYFVVYHFLK